MFLSLVCKSIDSEWSFLAEFFVKHRIFIPQKPDWDSFDFIEIVF